MRAPSAMVDESDSCFTSSECGPRASFARASQPSMPDDHSPLAPPLPIPNRTVKRRRADDSVDSHAKVGHRQAPLKAKAHPCGGPFALPVSRQRCRQSHSSSRLFCIGRPDLVGLVSRRRPHRRLGHLNLRDPRADQKRSATADFHLWNQRQIYA